MKKQKTTKKIPEKISSELMVPFLNEMKSFVHSAIRESERSVKEDLKDFVRSTAKGTQTVLGNRIDKVEKKVDSLDGEVKSLKTDVKQLQVAVLENRKEIRRVEKDLREEIKGESQSIRSDLKQEIRESEKRLGNKIDKNAIRLGDHATRITALEEAR